MVITNELKYYGLINFVLFFKRKYMKCLTEKRRVFDLRYPGMVTETNIFVIHVRNSKAIEWKDERIMKT